MTPTSPAAVNDLSALLALITDPEKHRQRLDELTAKEAEVTAQIEALHKTTADARGIRSEAEAARIVVDRRKLALDTREAEVAARAEAAERSHAEADRKKQESETASRKRAAEMDARDNALRQREAAIETRENGARAEADRLAALRTELETKLAKLKQLAA